MADEADEELLRFLASHHPDEVWETAERIMVAVSASPDADAVVHRAARIASRVKGDLLAGHVPTEEHEDPERLAALRQLVDDVGGAWHEIPGDDPAKAIVAFARQHQITQIVFGARRLTRLAELRRGSAVRRLLREAAEAGIDVHVIARSAERTKE